MGSRMVHGSPSPVHIGEAAKSTDHGTKRHQVRRRPRTRFIVLPREDRILSSRSRITASGLRNPRVWYCRGGPKASWRHDACPLVAALPAAPATSRATTSPASRGTPWIVERAGSQTGNPESGVRPFVSPGRRVRESRSPRNEPRRHGRPRIPEVRGSGSGSGLGIGASPASSRRSTRPALIQKTADHFLRA